MMFRSVNLSPWSLPFVILVWWTVQCVEAIELGGKCKNPVGDPGKCIPFRDCQPIVEILNKSSKTPEDKEFIMQSRCGVLERKVLVCCAQSSQRTSFPEAPHCGMQLTDRVFGGQATQIDEFPWTALVGFQDLDGSSGFHCGGSLINERYIVTAAHCIHTDSDDWKVHLVRLGEWDLATDNDCQDGDNGDGDIFCSNGTIDLEIEKIVVHSNYDPNDESSTNDIALIRFTRPVQYSETVRPICLPWSAAFRNRSHVGLPSWAAGWGRTESGWTSEKKLKIEMNITSMQKCATVYRRRRIYLTSAHICAGGVRGKDTCSGDSGGPLMRQIAGAWYLIGVVSFGLKCGLAGVPGVYANVAEYIDWMQDNI